MKLNIDNIKKYIDSVMQNQFKITYNEIGSFSWGLKVTISKDQLLSFKDVLRVMKNLSTLDELRYYGQVETCVKSDVKVSDYKVTYTIQMESDKLLPDTYGLMATKGCLSNMKYIIDNGKV